MLHPRCTPTTQVYTLGGSVTRGLGATRPEHNYANRFFQLVNASFPHRWVGSRVAARGLGWRRGWRQSSGSG